MTAPAVRQRVDGGGLLPPLRRDLDIEIVGDEQQGFPAAVVRDPVRMSYFRLGWAESRILLAWREAATAEQLKAQCRRAFGADVTDDDIAEVVGFAQANQLTTADRSADWRQLEARRARGRRGTASWLLHNYLFFRVPLVRPDPWLKAVLPVLAFAYSRLFWMGLAAVGLVGLYLAAHQWSALVVAAKDALRVESIALYATVLLALKVVHELGHAVTTARYGCRVPSMGLAMMLGVPVLYTDTTDSWRLSRRRERLAIVLAGVAAEAIVAVGAIVLWCFLADGTARTVCFALATASITLSLLVNLNPFMRYDGYFALSDMLRVPNLQARAFELGIWRLRELLFDLRVPPPEQLEPRLQRRLIAYAACTAVYRFFLYLGIAAMVYVIAGKAIGIVLGLVELMVFIGLPVAHELRTWWGLRGQAVKRPRFGWTTGVAAAGVAAMLVPWLSSVEVPAVLLAAQEEALHLPFPARLTEIGLREGQQVRAGEVLLVGDASDLQRDRARTLAEQKALTIQVGRLPASDKEREMRLVIESRLAQSREKLAAIERRLDQLVVRAPFDGRVVDVDPELSPGIWVGARQQLARVVVGQQSRARGMIAEGDLGRVRVGAAAVFVPDDPAMASRRLVVASISPASNGLFAEPVLADRHGGPVAAGSERGELVARQGTFEVAFEPFAGPTQQIVRGLARVEGDAVSPAQLVWRSVARVLVREQGF